MSAKGESVCNLSCGAMHEFALVLDKAGFDASLIQEIIDSKRNEKAKAMYAALIGGMSGGDERFELIKVFDVIVPKDYNHTVHLAKFKKRYRKDFCSYNDAITDKNFKKTIRLVPGRKFQVKVFQIKKTVTSGDCLRFLRSQNAVLVGAQGASLAYEQGKNQLSSERWSVSFDEKYALWVDSDGSYRVPAVNRYPTDNFEFCLGYFEGDWYGSVCLLCFCDLD